MKLSGGYVVLLTLDAFVALTAGGGGVALMAGLEADRFPLEWLRGTPFTSYTLPGLLLAALVGGSAAVAAALTLRNPRCGARASVLAGGVLMGWIVGETLLLEQPTAPHWTEVFYFVTGSLMALLGLALRRAPALRRTTGR